MTTATTETVTLRETARKFHFELKLRLFDNMDPPGAASDGSQPCQVPEEHLGLATPDVMTTDVMRMEKQISNQVFENAVKVHAEKNFSQLEAETDLADLVRDLEEAKVGKASLNNAYERLQMVNVLVESLSEDDPYRQRIIALLDNIQSVQEESRALEERIIGMKVERLEMKRRTLEKIKEGKDLQRETPPFSKEQELNLQKALGNMEKFKTMIEVTLNTLQRILIACKVNWMDDPKLRDLFLHPPASE